MPAPFYIGGGGGELVSVIIVVPAQIQNRRYRAKVRKALQIQNRGYEGKARSK